MTSLDHDIDHLSHARALADALSYDAHLDATTGEGMPPSSRVCIANLLDYMLQRVEANREHGADAEQGEAE